MTETSDIWYPSQDQIATANVSELIKRLGVANYDALYRFSVEHPDKYWRAVVDWCGIVWRKDYETFADFSAGREFPRWFAGGTLNWTDTIFAWARRAESANRAAVLSEGETGDVSSVTYAELESRTVAFAAGLLRRGIKRGDRIALLIEPGIEAVISMLALAHIGVIVMPLFSGFGVDPIVARMSAAGARGVIATSGFRRRGRHISTIDVLREVQSQLGFEFLIVKRADGEDLPDGAVAWSDVPVEPPEGFQAAEMASDEPLMIFYTSGTTGKPKGTVHVHGGFPLKIAHDSALHFEIKEGDVFFWPADMGWLAGALIIACTLMRGATMVCYDGAPDYPDWSRMSRMIERHKVTHFGAAPTMIRGLAAHADVAFAGDISTIKLLITAGEAIDPEHFVWHRRNFGRGSVPLINYSGGTEASGGLVSSVIVKPISPAGFNTASPGCVVDVVDANTGKPLVDEVGELAVLEPFVGMTKSFWHDDARYLETYWQTIPGMWIHGDLALRTKAGEFILRGRSDDTIKLAGKRTGPAEIEEVVMELANVSECAAIGIDNSSKGQALVVFVILTGTAASDDDFPVLVAQHAERRLGRAFRPSRVHVVEQLPKTRSGKVMRRVIRGVYCGTPTGDLSSLDNTTAIGEIERHRPE